MTEPENEGLKNDRHMQGVTLADKITRAENAWHNKDWKWNGKDGRLTINHTNTVICWQSVLVGTDA